mmetsp:Transcript_38918/g.60660  ORF Transcript_38918/g.60660 Transcript_38918/m.60660 type:complete len:119 (+) Transcript_38918:320-676(+)
MRACPRLVHSGPKESLTTRFRGAVLCWGRINSQSVCAEAVVACCAKPRHMQISSELLEVLDASTKLHKSELGSNLACTKNQNVEVGFCSQTNGGLLVATQGENFGTQAWQAMVNKVLS